MSSKYSRWNRRTRKSLREMTFNGSSEEFEEAQRIRAERWNRFTRGPTPLGQDEPSLTEQLLETRIAELENRKRSVGDGWTHEEEELLRDLEAKRKRLRRERGASTASC